VFNANVKGTFFLTQALIPHIQPQGRIINISSTAAAIAESDFIAYSMTKSALETHTKALARDLGEKGITVNTIQPGWIETDLNRQFWQDNPQIPAAAASSSALKRTGTPVDVGPLVAFLTTPNAAFITAQVIEVSGGYTL
jgi:NAD(P)-dependent dehydrogenase (short-subunit alcohol dehydrogenase family)